MREMTDRLYAQEDRLPGMLSRSERVLAGVILLFYFFARYTVFEHLDALIWWAPYAFEAVFVGCVGIYYRDKLSFGIEADGTLLRHAATALVAGLLISLGVWAAQVPVPFAMDEGRTVFLALNVAPALEEGLFRLALWVPMAMLLVRRNPAVLLALNAAMFSAVHLYSLTVAPEEYVPFILIQSLYVIGLGGVCGWWMLRTMSIFYPITIHYLFNLGFYLPYVF